MALTQVVAVIGSLHYLTIAFMSKGLLDQYTSTALIHYFLLLTGPQLIHFFRFRHLLWHRRIYWLNTCLILVESVISFGFPTWMSRNLNYCPELRRAFRKVPQEHLRSTIAGLVINVIFSVLEYWWSTYNVRRRTFLDREKNGKRRPVLPRWVTWDKSMWSGRRMIYCALGILWAACWVAYLESFILGTSYSLIKSLTDNAMSSTDNAWQFGQILALVQAATQLCINVRCGLLEFTKPWARRHRGLLPEICLPTLALRDGPEPFVKASEVGKGRFLYCVHWLLNFGPPRKIAKTKQSISNDSPLRAEFGHGITEEFRKTPEERDRNSSGEPSSPALFVAGYPQNSNGRAGIFLFNHALLTAKQVSIRNYMKWISRVSDNSTVGSDQLHYET